MTYIGNSSYRWGLARESGIWTFGTSISSTSWATPELRVWTDQPRPLEVSHPSQIPVGRSEVWVRVAGDPAGAMVAIVKGDEVYDRGIIGLDSQLSFLVNPSTPGRLKLTATALNLLPYEAELMVLPDGPSIRDRYQG